MAFKESNVYSLTRPVEYPFGSCAIEYKVTKKPRFYLRDIKEHQRTALLRAKDSVYFKIPDARGAYAAFAQQSPFDSFLLRGAEGYVGILWYQPRKPKVLRFFNIEVIERIIAEGIKSLLESDAIKYQVYEQIL